MSYLSAWNPMLSWPLCIPLDRPGYPLKRAYIHFVLYSDAEISEFCYWYNNRTLRPYFVTQTCYSSILSISICSSVLWDAVKLAAGKKNNNFRIFDPTCFYINLFLIEARFLRSKAGFTNHAEGATSPGPQTSRGPTTSCFTVCQLLCANSGTCTTKTQ